MNQYDDIIRRHFHGLSDATWKIRKHEYPYCEIPAIIQDVVNNLNIPEVIKPVCPECGAKAYIMLCCTDRNCACYVP